MQDQHPNPRFLIAAAHKSSGKTVVSTGLAAALHNTGRAVQCFKKGPDYIDPMWLSAASGRACYNPDSNTMGGDALTHLSDRPIEELLTSPPQVGLWHEVKADDPPGRIFEVIAHPMEEGADAKGFVLIIREVTREREFEQHVRQQERLAAVGQLAAGIAHDFNNIMAVIMLYAQMSLRTPGLPPKIMGQSQTMM